MPGRKDFAQIHARLIADPRAHAAAGLYVTAGLALPATALATVIGHVAMLGVWAVRETDDGVLPGDGEAAASVASCVTGPGLRAMLDALLSAGLLRREDSGIYLVGFRECYSSIITKRENAKAYNREKREKREKRNEAQRRRRNVGATLPPRRDNVTSQRERRVSANALSPYPAPLEASAGTGTQGPGPSGQPQGSGTAAATAARPDRAAGAAIVAARLAKMAEARRAAAAARQGTPSADGAAAV